MMFGRILIANRGEIACRIIRTAQRLGIRTIAVYSAADAQAMHVAMADEAHLIGPGPARESYLSIPHILDAARRSQAEAIHPGYGFLSENAEFAEACTAAGIVFIGPSASTIRAMGDKAQAKTIMEQAGIPTVPGYRGEEQEHKRFAEEARRLGYPVLIKAASGGGGRGMRIVTEPAQFAASLESAKREALSAFGKDRVILEKYLARPRHVEVQVFGDRRGNVAHLFERDCSAQRRHQKVVEEAPTPDLDQNRQRVLRSAAVTAARAANYVGAGTVEFILHGGEFYFIEMNTRLQVEHPVTEMTTGYDLVEWQIRIAAGEALPVAQNEICSRGHAVEARLYAEDPGHDFAPATGLLRRFRLPASEPDLRVETGVREGDEISIFYDPMIAKLVAWGEDRAAARRRLEAALIATDVAGIANNRDFLLRLIGHPDFAAGAIDTGFIESHRAALALPLSAAPFVAVAAASLALLNEEKSAAARAAARSHDPHSPWSLREGWSLAAASDYEIHWSDAGTERRLRIRLGDDRFRMTSDETSADVGLLSSRGTELIFEFQSAQRIAKVTREGNEFTVALEGETWRLRHLDPLARQAQAELGPARLAARMHGRVLDVLVSPGSSVRRGQVLILLECMKLEYSIAAPADGMIEAVHYAPGNVVEEGTLLLAFTPSN